MKIVGVVRTLNEDDIVEAVIRHQLAQMDHVVVLDDGSRDQTVEILNKLIAEGLNVTLIERRSVVADEIGRLTFLFEYARDKLSADWVVCFDADEFLDMRLTGASIRDYLKAVPSSVDGIQVSLVNYDDVISEHANEIIVPKRLVWRHKAPLNVYKVIVRGRPGITIRAGNHGAFREGSTFNMIQIPEIVFAHYPRRSGWQDMYKWTIKRLKITAAGKRETSKGTGTHYIKPFEILVNRPGDLVYNEHFFKRTPDLNRMVNNPIDYVGGELRYTEVPDYKMKCISMILKYCVELATDMGHLVDTNESVRKYVEQKLR